MMRILTVIHIGQYQAAETSSFDAGNTSLDKTLGYLELSDDESVETKDLRGINTLGLSDEGCSQSGINRCDRINID